MKRFLFALCAVALIAGCSGSDDAGSDGGGAVIDPATQPKEWVSFHTEIPTTPSEFDALANGMFGAAAQSGQLVTNQEVGSSFFVTALADPSTNDQVRLQFSYDDGSDTPRTLAETPASFQLGKLFIDTVDAAMAQMQSDVAAGEAGGERFDLEYQVTSTQGGTLSFGIKGDSGAYTLAVDVTTPHTSLVKGQVGMAASGDAPYDVVSGTVWFGMDQDEFDYFVDHAYGKGATAGQNFNDFALVPYQWLRLTVTPSLQDNFVDVAFDLLRPDGSRVAISKAPASVPAGNTFATLVDRQMTNMTAAERAQPGSSTPWSIPFYYDQPSGGGVVQVIASGAAGKYNVAYAVASPRHPLVDVPFVAYKPLSFPPPDPNATKACYQRGDPNLVQSLHGVFDITFQASDVIKNGLQPGETLQGDIGCSIYHASDVSITGPKDGAVSLEDFTLTGADLLATPLPHYTTETQLADGEYQILCAQYVDGNDAQVSAGDPVTLPIGGFIIACNTNPVTVEFAIRNPADR